MKTNCSAGLAFFAMIALVACEENITSSAALPATTMPPAPAPTTTAPPTMMMLDAGATQAPPVDAHGNAVATWVEPVTSSPRPHLFAAHFASAAGTWTAPVDLVVDPNATPYSAETQLSVNAKGEAIVVWHQETDMPPSTSIWARVYR